MVAGTAPNTLTHLTTRLRSCFATSSTIARGSLGQLCHVCVSCTRKALEPFEPYSHSATVQARFKGSNGGSRVRVISERSRLYCPPKQGEAPKLHTFVTQDQPYPSSLQIFHFVGKYPTPHCQNLREILYTLNNTITIISRISSVQALQHFGLLLCPPLLSPRKGPNAVRTGFELHSHPLVVPAS